MAVITKSIGVATGRDYSSISSWESAQQGNLVSLQEIHKGECYADSSYFDESVTISGSTTSSDYYMYLTVAEGNRHDGTKSGGGVVIDRQGGAYSYGVYAPDSYTFLEYLRVTGLNGGNSVVCIGIMDGGGEGHSGVVIKDCIVHDISTNCNTSTGFWGIVSTCNNAKIINCQVFNMSRTSAESSWTVGLGCTISTSKTINCSAFNITDTNGSAVGIHGGRGNGAVINCISLGASGGYSTDFNVTYPFSSDDCKKNISSDHTAPSTARCNTVLTTDVSGNTGYTVKDADGYFITKSVQEGDVFINITDKKTSVIASVDSETQLTLNDSDVAGNSKSYRVNADGKYFKTTANNYISTTYGSENLLLLDSSDAVDYGVGHGTDSNVPTDDIIDNTRPDSACDVGCYQNMASGTCPEQWIDEWNRYNILARSSESICIKVDSNTNGSNTFKIISGSDS